MEYKHIRTLSRTIEIVLIVSTLALFLIFYFFADVFRVRFPIFSVFGSLLTLALLGIPLQIREYAKSYKGSDLARECLDNIKRLSIIGGFGLIAWFSMPANITETYTVYGILAYDGSVKTHEAPHHCYKDALETAERFYKNRQSWARNEDGTFAECDVNIDISKRLDVLNPINTFFSTHFGETDYSTSLHYLNAKPPQ